MRKPSNTLSTHYGHQGQCRERLQLVDTGCLFKRDRFPSSDHLAWGACVGLRAT